MIKEYMGNPYKGKTEMHIYTGFGRMFQSGVYNPKRRELIPDGKFVNKSSNTLRTKGGSGDGINLEEVVIVGTPHSDPSWPPVIDNPDIPVYPGNGGGGGGGGGTPSAPPEIKDSLLNKCMKNVKDILIIQNGSVNSLLRNFTDDSSFSPNYTWILENKTLPEPNLAITGNWDRVNRNVTTKIDDSKFTNASDLAIAKTLLHEGIHAYLVAYFANDASNANKEYNVLFDNYISSKNPDLNEIHHNEIARLFVSQIANSLKEFGDSRGYSFSSSFEKDRFYNDLAWGDYMKHKHLKPSLLMNKIELKMSSQRNKKKKTLPVIKERPKEKLEDVDYEIILYSISFTNYLY